MKRLLLFIICSFIANAAQAGEPMLLPSNPNLSPDGATVVFDWHGDIWSVPVAGGVAKPLTRHSAADREPTPRRHRAHWRAAPCRFRAAAPRLPMRRFRRRAI